MRKLSMENNGLKSYATNKKPCTCVGCHKSLDSGNGYGVQVAGRTDGKLQYMCSSCRDNNRGYHDTDPKKVGNTRTPLTCGIEFEMSAHDDILRATAYRFEMTATRDGSLYGRRTVEFVTPTHCGFMKLTKQIVSMGSLLEQGHWYMDSSCGTHFHCGWGDMTDYMPQIRKHCIDIFGKMQDLMNSNPEKTEEFFGRFFTSYAPYGLSDSIDHEERYHWVNLTLKDHLEFRLNKFISGTQYHNVCKFEIEATKYIVESMDNNVPFDKIGRTLASRLKKAWA